MGDSGLSAVVSLIVGIAGAYFVGRAIWRGWEAPPSLRNNKVRIGWGILGALMLIMVVGNLATGGDKPSGGQASREGVVAKEQTPKPDPKPQPEQTRESKPQREKPQSNNAPAQPDTTAASPGNTVTVVHVVDGDTFDIDHPIHGMDRVRLIGVDTPEVYGGTEPCGREASAYTKRRLEGQRVSLEIGKDDTDPYGRLLAFVFIGDGFGSEFYNKTLVDKGLAKAVSYPPNTRYDLQLDTAEIMAEVPSCAHPEPSPSPSPSPTASPKGTSSPAPTASPKPNSNSNGQLHNGVDDVNCEDLSGPVPVDVNDEDNLDADGDGIGCD